MSRYEFRVLRKGDHDDEVWAATGENFRIEADSESGLRELIKDHVIQNEKLLTNPKIKLRRTWIVTVKDDEDFEDEDIGISIFD